MTNIINDFSKKNLIMRSSLRKSSTSELKANASANANAKSKEKEKVVIA